MSWDLSEYCALERANHAEMVSFPGLELLPSICGTMKPIPEMWVWRVCSIIDELAQLVVSNHVLQDPPKRRRVDAIFSASTAIVLRTRLTLNVLYFDTSSL